MEKFWAVSRAVMVGRLRLEDRSAWLRAVERDSSRVWRPWSIWLRALSSWMLAEMIWFTASVMVRTPADTWSASLATPSSVSRSRSCFSSSSSCFCHSLARWTASSHLTPRAAMRRSSAASSAWMRTYSGSLSISAMAACFSSSVMEGFWRMASIFA